MSSQHGRQQPGEHRPVCPVRLGPGDLTPENRDFMAHHHDLRVFGGLAAARQRQPAKDPDHDQM